MIAGARSGKDSRIAAPIVCYEAALGGEATSARRKGELAARAALLLDAVDAWVFEQRSVVNMRTRALLPVVVQRHALAEHLAKLLDRLGLDRIPRQVTDLTAYVRERYGEGPSPVASDSASPAPAEYPSGEAHPACIQPTGRRCSGKPPQ